MWPRYLEIAFELGRRIRWQGNEADFAAFPMNLEHGFVAAVMLDTQSDQLGDAEPRTIQQLDDESVALTFGVGIRSARDGLRLSSVEGPR